MADPTFGVVMPTRNRAQLAVEAVRRITSLAGAPDQFVVIDDGSHDDTTSRVSEMSDVDVLTTDGVGPASARNVGVARIDTDWLVFVDDDDRPHHDWMTSFRRMAANCSDASHLSVGFLRRTGSIESINPPRPLGPAFGDFTANFIAGTFAVRTELFRSVGGFGEGLRAMTFTELALRMFDHIRRSRSLVRHLDLTTISIIVAPPEQRGSRQAEVLEMAWERVWRDHESLLRRDRSFLADQHSTLGVAWARAGNLPKARRHMLEAARLHPTSARLLRCSASLIPAIARRTWSVS